MANGHGGKRAGSGRPKAAATVERAHYLTKWLEVVTLADHEEIIGVVLTLAKQGEAWAVREYFDRMEGKVSQTLTLEGSEERPLHVRSSPREDGK